MLLDFQVTGLFSLIEWRWLELGHDEGMKNMAQLYLADEDAGDVDGGCLELRKLWNWTKPRIEVPAVETEECRDDPVLRKLKAVEHEWVVDICPAEALAD